jgi:hypothetical protein
MSSKKRNRHGNKGSEKENRSGALPPIYRKLSPNSENEADESISTAGDESDPKYSRIGMRKDEKEKRR